MAHKNIKLIIGLVMIILLVYTVPAATKIYYAQEGDFIKIRAEAIDPDKDFITYNYAAPFDDEGEWQTGFDDAGEHEIAIIASDGKSEDIKTIKIIVHNTNLPPDTIENRISVKETQLVDLKSLVSDPDNDVISYTFSAPFDDQGQWQTGYDDQGVFVTTFTMYDGFIEVTKRVEIEVLHTNQPPEIIDIFSTASFITARENEPFSFYFNVRDGDNDPMTVLWKIDGQIISDELSGEYMFGYEDAGKHELTLTITDDTNTIERKWTLTVRNTNREPRLVPQDITVNEGEKVVLNLPKKDIDGDILQYTYDEPLSENGEWQLSFEDAGTYSLEITASDGDLQDKTTIDITVVDVDRAPVLTLPQKLWVDEGGELEWEIETYDPDKDDVTITVSNAPDDSVIRKNKFSWEPDYDTITRKGGFVSTILNTVRLEHFFLQKKSVPITVEVCGKDKCTTGTVDIIVYNVNRKPELTNIQPITVRETETVNLEAYAVDPDDDIMKYSYSWPLNKKSGEWETGYEDEDTYEVYVSATDGKETDTIPVTVRVARMNREPEIDVQDTVVVNEGQEFTLNAKAFDKDEESVSLSMPYLPEGASFAEGIFVWTPPYTFVKNKSDSVWNNVVSNWNYLNKKMNSEKEVVWIEFTARDTESTVVHPVKITVKNVNRKPELLDYLPATETTVHMNEKITFHAVASDVDEDTLSYSWSFSPHEPRVKETSTITRTFVTPGRKSVTVKISDGRDTVKKTWIVNVLESEYVTPANPGVGPYRTYIIEH
ncbi:PKD domain-containing protein [Candidatus Woesearchaeota archaeon]|jgi:hypothetical protein|nr:PKD domain-containing protein [Candidatus Woesearchaeota archaeon]MBT5397468.1 PKD domain-containing protein [Candidatus Woesearchaeota archaeon]MBT6367959.1 PKD domain-containing protein [Candidatus Woesearchaeota archaeon]MBT7763183.1 PKD domain-containing protein [Candidatus Woesearchaeota archaeon]